MGLLAVALVALALSLAIVHVLHVAVLLNGGGATTVVGALPSCASSAVRLLVLVAALHFGK